MEGTHDNLPERGREELERPGAADRWRAMLAALSLYAPAAHARLAALATLRDIALRTPTAVAPYAADLAWALDADERRARWDALVTLALACEAAPETVGEIAELVGAVLYQPDSPAMRRTALVILTTAALESERTRAAVWPLLDEALLLMRNEPEYPAVLASVVRVLAEGVDWDDHLWEYAVQDANDRRARVRVLAWKLRLLLSER
jgi:hypothetical protein